MTVGRLSRSGGVPCRNILLEVGSNSWGSRGETFLTLGEVVLLEA